MEHVEGQDLSSYMSSHGPLGVEQAINVILQAAQGLAYAHGLGISIATSSRPTCLLDLKGTVKILDRAWPASITRWPMRRPSKTS